MNKEDYIFIGLGNPGEQYNDTLHNVGFLLVDELAKRWGGTITKEKWNAQFLSITKNGDKVHLIKPMTFMNRSGQAVAQFCRFYKVQPQQLLVFHDDLDMPPGRIKLVKGGGAGGHNGIKSLVEMLGTKDFYRLKVGIGRPGNGDVHPDFPVEKYVLSNFNKEDSALLASRYNTIEDGICLFLEGNPARAMNLLNTLK